MRILFYCDMATNVLFCHSVMVIGVDGASLADKADVIDLARTRSNYDDKRRK